MPNVAPSPITDPAMLALVDQYQRRGGSTGGVWKGAGKGAMMGANYGKYFGAGIVPAMAGGALVGGIVGAAKKHANSAPTDFGVGDAQSAIGNAYQQYLGRAASPEEIQAQLGGQGWKAGNRYVGQSGLTSVLGAIRNSDEAKAYGGTQGGLGGAPGSPSAVGSTGMPMTPDRQALMDSLRQGTPNKDALVKMFA